MKKARKTAYAGLFTALCVALLFLGSVIEVLDLSTAALGSLIIIAAMIELGKGYAIAVYAAASLLSALLLPNKAPAVYFILFSGYYPVLKVFLNNIKPKPLSYAARFAVFDIALAGAALVTVYLLNTPIEFEVYWWIAGILLANGVFFVYDIALERMSLFYVRHIKSKFKYIFKGRR
ncbi:MAG: hypothetical protein J5793_01180 [Clostridia bacterium]|nr:hypothetical protein [Clostridia bacterium]